MQIQTDYHQAGKRKYPEQVALAIAREKDGKYNPITLGWCMTTSFAPPMLAISVGLTRYSLEVIREAGEFVICYPSADMADEALFFGSHSGRNTDKFAESRVKLQPAQKIDCVILSDAVANFECRLVSEHTTGDHVILVGQVAAAWMNEDKKLKRLYALASGHVLGALKE